MFNSKASNTVIAPSPQISLFADQEDYFLKKKLKIKIGNINQESSRIDLFLKYQKGIFHHCLQSHKHLSIIGQKKKYKRKMNCKRMKRNFNFVSDVLHLRISGISLQRSDPILWWSFVLFFLNNNFFLRKELKYIFQAYFLKKNQIFFIRFLFNKKKN